MELRSALESIIQNHGPFVCTVLRPAIVVRYIDRHDQFFWCSYFL